ncbi:NF-X1-type zinc finger protein NFXL1 [Hibiscus syriacus]|uniref:NF-X1-type zinc finger protein NFXL1 n=1 Tax=Hibiscus syriacus TaxID=106335 RepID=A0A6A3BXP2_HIBSY|nr:NF-X1-type zinc finger protein NFXL1-like [Hibiscus syriacus]KAE8719749.1 NF-X1-type zinc finger protein NFXL1 [Hibiscus syriacus]
MSFHGRKRSTSRSTRQEWIPRGSSSATTTVESSSPAASDSTSNVNQASIRNDDRYRLTGGPTNHRGDGEKERAENHVAVRKEIDCNSPQLAQEIRDKQPINHRRDGKKERSANFVAVKKGLDPNLPQLLQEIQDKLIKSTVECMICCDMVKRSGTIWSCSSCYSIFHLNCIKKWARAPTSVDLVTEKNQGFNWRCPGCQSVQFTSSKEIRYVCFCGKRNDPPPDLYLTPHSCGEPCGKPLEKELGLGSGVMKDELCPHNCVLQCHPGPCPPCKAFAPPSLCPCGKKVITTRCPDRKSFLTCGQQCDKLLECGRHHCEQVCHIGACDPCKVLINAPCFCKKKVEVVICGDMVVKGEVKAEDGIFSCNSTCGKKLRCGNHYCAELCHPGPCEDCEFMPSKIRSCYCGKTSLQDQRQSCLDPIPTCSEICAKFLPCQVHRCDQACHAGSCPPCLVLVTQKCLCGSTSRRVECYKTTLENERFMCDKPCGRKKNCGRHRCSERCCPSSNSNNLGSGGQDPHSCQMTCGKKLRCGQHSCESFCHSGHCPPCLETIFTDLTCACGRTSIPPPLPCGTPPPSCQLPCSVPQACGHSSSHSCHFGDCPPCSVLVAKECIGGHVVLRNIPCGSKDIRCNKLCGKTRQCGLHACGRTCHPEPCDASSGVEQGFRASCGQTCGAPRQDCRHTCTAPCHPSAPCPDVRCDFRVTIACSCGRLSATVPCDAGGFNADTVFKASIIQKLPVPLQPVESAGKRIPLGQRKLMCDDECAKLERKRALADAFDITPPNLDSLHFGENSVTSELIFDLYRRDPKWVLAVEERCKFLVLGKNRGTTTGLKVHVFCPMLKDKSDAVRIIAERWKLAISAAGWEPKRFIVVHATPKSKPPARIIGVKGSTGSGSVHPPVFDPLVDMDPRLVVSFLDLPREADISALVLRFGGECELVWMNDKNALAVFSDPARAATAMRRLDHGSIYTGASTFVHSGGASAPNNAWGGTGPSSALKANPWKKAVTQEVGWGEHSWGGDESLGGTSNPGSAWKDKDTPIPASINRWSVLDSETGVNSTSGAVQSEDPSKLAGVQSMSTTDSNATNSNSAGLLGRSLNETEPLEVVDDWEKAYE